ncbi:MAG: transcriptional regulator [Rhodocyclales bacterium]|nr:transcriptional regulator [Rhodocyclales bacterium]
MEHKPVPALNCFTIIRYFHYYRMMEEKDIVQALAALAQPMRLRVFRALVVAGTGGLTPSVIADQLHVPPATLSFHLKELTHASLITQERDGRNLIYRAAFDTMNGLLGYLTDHCCQGQPCLDETAVACKC